MDKSNQFDKFQEYLDNLPKTVWGLVALLSSKGIKGEACSCWRCPLAELFAEEFPEMSFEVTRENVLAYLGTFIYKDFTLPPACTTFTLLVDDHKLPAFEDWRRDAF